MPDTKGQANGRFVVKMSGQALEGDASKGIICGTTIAALANTLKTIVTTANMEIVVIVGGGNIARGQELQQQNVSRNPGDTVGMLATIANAIMFGDALEQAGQPARAMSAIPMDTVAEPYILKRALRHLDKGRVVIIGGGIARPRHSTDFAAAQYAAELEATRVIMAKNGVDQVYDKDPNEHDDAKPIPELSCDEFLARGLKVCDGPAVVFCGRNGVSIQVVGIENPMNIFDAVRGLPIGTLIHP